VATSAEYGLGHYAFPRGWFALANAGDVGREPQTVHYFGQDLVLYRGASGRFVMLDAYCPHMGTHLGSAPNSATSQSDIRMEGDAIRCPFHAWRFGADGMCDHIPYHDGPIPPKARVKSWLVEEHYGIIFAWHDPEGLEPDFPVCSFPEWDDASFVRWQGLEYLCDLSHPVEIFDNMSDCAHLHHLHGTRVTRYENEYAGVVMHQRQCSLSEGVEGMMGKELTTLSGYVGPGIAFGRFEELQAAEIICVTPIDDGSCRLWQAAMIRPPNGIEGQDAQNYRDAVSRQFGQGLLRDGEIWRAKRPALQIMQLPSDGPFRQSRTWYSQFFHPREKAKEISQRIEGVCTATGMPPFTPVEAG
jgi:3-ketosteroid 9alpha-monooxygenase subunit A